MDKQAVVVWTIVKNVKSTMFFHHLVHITKIESFSAMVCAIMMYSHYPVFQKSVARLLLNRNAINLYLIFHLYNLFHVYGQMVHAMKLPKKTFQLLINWIVLCMELFITHGNLLLLLVNNVLLSLVTQIMNFMNN